MDFLATFFGNFALGMINNAFMGSPEQMDWSQFREQALGAVSQLQNQVGDIVSWGETEKNFVDVAQEFDIKSVTDSARTDLEDVVGDIQQFDVKTGFASSGIVDTMKTEEQTAIYDEINKTFSELDIVSEREKSGIDMNTEQMLNNIENMISNIAMQYSGTTGELLEFGGFGGTGFQDPVTAAETFTPQQMEELRWGTGSFAGTTPNPYGLSGEDWAQSQSQWGQSGDTMSGPAGYGTYMPGLGGSGSGYGQPGNPGGFTPSGTLGQTFIWETNQYAPAGEQLGVGFQGWGTRNYGENITGPGSGNTITQPFQGLNEDALFAGMNTPEMGAAVVAFNEGFGTDPFGQNDSFAGGITSSGYYDPNNPSWMGNWQTAGFTQGSGPTGQWSDRRLKTNIELVGKSPKGYNIYEFEYINKHNGPDRYRGVMADEVQFAAFTDADGYDLVNYSHPDLDVEFERII